MNPFLQRRWGDFHSRLMNVMSEHLQERLPQGLFARMDERIYIEDQPLERREARPDVFVYEGGGKRAKSGAAAAAVSAPSSAAAVAEPIIFQVPEYEAREVFLNIIDAQTGGAVITSIEFLSPSNKRPGSGRKLYLRKQSDCTKGKVNLVEIDLIRGGRATTLMGTLLASKGQRAGYHVSILRAARPTELGYIPCPLRAAMPAFNVPLRPTDSDVVAELQTVVNEAFRRGYYGDIDYGQPLKPALSAEDAAWASGIIANAQ
jgi:hypothetical protein